MIRFPQVAWRPMLVMLFAWALGLGQHGVLQAEEADAIFPAAPDSIAGVHVVTAEEVVRMLLGSEEVLLIDVKLEEEFLLGHIEGAINILDSHLTREDLELRVESTDSPIIIYCNGFRCNRSANASRKAVEWGFTNVHWFRGGWDEWMRKRLPVAR